MSGKSKGKNAARELAKRLARAERAHREAVQVVPGLLGQLQLMREQRRLMVRVIARLLPLAGANAEHGARIDFDDLDTASTVGFGAVREGGKTFLVVMPPLAEDPDPGPVSRAAVMNLEMMESEDGRQEAGGEARQDRTEGEGPDVGNREA